MQPFTHTHRTRSHAVKWLSRSVLFGSSTWKVYVAGTVGSLCHQILQAVQLRFCLFSHFSINSWPWTKARSSVLAWLQLVADMDVWTSSCETDTGNGNSQSQPGRRCAFGPGNKESWDEAAAVLEFWENNKTAFPRLYAMTRKIFCVPAATAGVERLFSISGFVLSSKRLRLTDRNFHDAVFAHCNFHLPVCKRRANGVKN